MVDAQQAREFNRKDGAGSPSLSEQAYQHLVEQIIRGHLRYGDKLNIKSIAAELNMSAMPIRDAIKRLEVENMVVVKPRSNCFLRIPTRAMTLEAIESRQMLELCTVSKVYASVTQDDLEGLGCILGDMERCVGAGRSGRDDGIIQEYIELDHRFHTGLCALARNRYVDRFYRETSMHLSMGFRYGYGVCQGLEATFADHQAIYGHLLDNSSEALVILERHLAQSRKNILSEPTFSALTD